MLKEMGNLYWSAHNLQAGTKAINSDAETNNSLNIAILYGSNSIFTSTVKDHLDSFKNYSRHNYYYFDAILDAPCNVDLNFFDVVIIHYGCGLYHPGYFSSSFEERLKKFGGLVVAFCQDEYDSTNVLIDALLRLRVSVVFTCVPTEYIRNVYSDARLSRVKFINNLTGYVPEEFKTSHTRKPIDKRGISIGYRGRPLHLKYGELGIQKIEIGKVLASECERYGVFCDIKWTEEERIYWAEWKEFLSNCRATLGTESGSNVFDYDGEIRKLVDEELSRPGAQAEDVYERLVKPHEGVHARMNQISPKMFEAISLGTGLILMEGSYSGILNAWDHYIPLKKDYSNIEEVFGKVNDVDFMSKMTERAYNDIVLSGKFSYKSFASMFDAELAKLNIRSKGLKLVNTLSAVFDSGTKWEIFPDERRDRWNKQWNDRYIDCCVIDSSENVCANGTAEPLFHYDIQSLKLHQQSITSQIETASNQTETVGEATGQNLAESKYRELAALSVSNYIIARSGSIKDNKLFCRLVRKITYLVYPLWDKSSPKFKSYVRATIVR